ncbi:glutamate--tRNA ligase 1 [Spirochaetota bacterium]|nr:glutamate--tRNA ligase 1 [Spirochaetota bacterium]
MNIASPGQKPRLRFAPSPTGSLHVGGARTALFNYLYARAMGGVFVLRIEDTDRERSTDQATSEVLQSLAWLGIDWDEGPAYPLDEGSAHLPSGGKERGDYGPYYQSKRLSIYNEQMDRLVSMGKAYLCFCTDEELGTKRKLAESMGRPYVYDGKCRALTPKEREIRCSQKVPYTIRFHSSSGAPSNARELVFNDMVKHKVRFNTELIGDFVIRKSNGFPTYNFAVVVDDALMNITHILRGDDHISNTPRQLLLYEALGYAPPLFAHVAMILGPRREKLSKRDGATSIIEFKRAGYYPDPFINHLALLGWSPEDGVEIISRNDLKKAFQSLKFASAPAIFDYHKLDYLNGHYIRGLSDEKIIADFKTFLNSKTSTASYLNVPKIDDLLLLLRGHCRKISDIATELAKLLDPADKLVGDEKALVNENSSRSLYSLGERIFSENIDDPFISAAEFERFKEGAARELGLKGKAFFIPLRLKLMQSSKGIELNKYFEFIPRETILTRLHK